MSEEKYSSEAEACEELVSCLRCDLTAQKDYLPRASSLPDGTEN
jgi:hypothetical protein